jgi:hypothetical protein
MINTANIIEILSTLALVLGAIAGIIKGSIEIAKWLSGVAKRVQNSQLYKTMLRVSIFLLFFLSIAVPNGILVWFMMFLVGQNLGQILSPTVFYSIILQTTLLVSIYSFLWGVWLAPLLRRSYQKQEPPL